MSFLAMTNQRGERLHVPQLSQTEVAAINERLSALGANAGTAKALMADMLEVMAELNLTVTDSLWRTQGGNDAFLRTAISEATGERRNWDTETHQGLPFVAYVRKINASLHCTERTSGGNRLRDTVIYAQGGDYCALCGAHDELEVDHIDPVSAGGPRDAVANLQLLCSACNGGKGAYQSRLLPLLLTPCTSDQIAAAVRFKCLQLASRPIRGRQHAQCSTCGCDSSMRRIFVERHSYKLAANLFNVRTKCTACL
jgi:hypothetical protein